jgi:hypothetical protein
MVKESDPGDSSPRDFPQTTPRDLFPTSDIRFVMHSIGGLSTKVDALLKSVETHGDKIDDLRQKVSFVKGAVWVLGAVMAFVILAATWYFSGKLSITVLPA